MRKASVGFAFAEYGMPSAASFNPAVQEAVEPGSVVRTDGWGGYNNLGSLGYVRAIVRKDADVGDNLLPCCNRVASLLKRWLLGTHHRERSVMSILSTTLMNAPSDSIAEPLVTRQAILSAHTASRGD